MIRLRWLGALVVSGAMVFGALAHGQGGPQSAVPPPQAAPARTTPAELQALRDAAKLADPAARVKALDEILATYPNSSYLVDVHAQKIQALQAMTPVDVRAVDAEIAKARTARTPRTPHEVLSLLAMTLQASTATLGRAETLQREAIGSIDEETYARDWQKRYTKHPDDPKEAAAQYKEGKSRYAGDQSRYYLTLGRILLKEGREADATAAFEQSLAFVPLQGSASLALATIAEKKGETAEAYRRLAWAAITGRLPAAERARLATAYAALHPAAPAADLDLDLDRLFRESFKNPIVTGPYAPTSLRTSRTVLAEMFTGAGCVPCLSVDLTFDAMLERYSRDELTVLMYHIHAPTSDPLSNTSVQARSQYYGINGAPTTFIDGTRELAEGPRADAPEIFKQIDAQVLRRLESPSSASIQLGANWRGSMLAVSATVKNIAAAPSPDLRLQIALVERLVRYSGENGQRFHPMVVRALAGQAANGFAIDASKAETTAGETFDLDALATANLQYYDDYAQELKARVGLTVTFLEHTHVIDPSKLAVVAFVQDAKTRLVLQSVLATPARIQLPSER